MKVPFFLAVCIVALSPLQAAPEYAPGATEINERDILERMAQEIGERPGTKTNTAGTPKTQTVAEAARPPETAQRRISLIMKNGETAAGSVILSQKAFVLKPDGHDTSMGIPLDAIRSVQFEEWKSLISVSRKQYFVPVRCKVAMKDGRTITGVPETEDWMQFNLEAGAFRSYYTVEAEADTPPPAVVVSIELSPQSITADASN